MARVVQRRSTPPYLVIIFVFLFLVSTALAVMWKMDADEKKDDNAKLKARSDKLASTRELRTPAIELMMKNTAASKSAGRRTVVGQFIENERNFSKIITGRQDVSLDAIQRASKLLGASESGRGLLAQVELLQKQLAAEVENLKALDEKLRDKDVKLADLAVQLGKRDESKAAKVAELQLDIDRIETQLQKEQNQHVEQRNRDQEENTTRVAQRDKTIANLNADKQKLQMESQTLRVTIAERDSKIDELTDIIRGRDSDDQVAKIGVGKILSEVTQDNHCFISLGRRDGVKPGFTFAVYSGSVIAKDAKPQGSLVVTKVHKSISVCRVTKVADNYTFSTNDTISNLAFNTSRTYVFVVAGLFDLHGSGKPSLTGAKEVAMLIKRYGGKVAQDVDVKTDYVIIGAEMSRPSKPGPDEPATVLAAYRQQMIVHDRVYDIKRKAITLRIRMLNTNRFMDYIGMIPTKTLTYE